MGSRVGGRCQPVQEESLRVPAVGSRTERRDRRLTGGLLGRREDLLRRRLRRRGGRGRGGGGRRWRGKHRRYGIRARAFCCRRALSSSVFENPSRFLVLCCRAHGLEFGDASVSNGCTLRRVCDASVSNGCTLKSWAAPKGHFPHQCME